MSFSFKLKSHVKEGQAFEDGQYLIDHLQGVADIAVKTSKMHGIDGDIIKIIHTICMCHDFGKSSEYFQQYLKGNAVGHLKDHGEISAYFAYYMLPEEWKLIGFMCVKRHHGNMEPDISFFDYEKNHKNLLKIAESIKKNLEELNEIYGEDISSFFDELESEKFLREPLKKYRKTIKKWDIENFIWLQYIWSLLLTGDKSQIIRGSAYQNKVDIYEDFVSTYKNKVRAELIEKNPKIQEGKLFKIRNQIYEEAIHAIDEMDITKNHIFSINVPTGTGKTLSVYGAAFRLLERIYQESNQTICPTIIYALPFTSVIDQNYDVLQNILTTNDIETVESFILKHHSMTELCYREDESKEYKDFDARFCVENWQSTIITTTFIQLFNSIFEAGKNSIIHRFHKLAGSIIILDEVQAIDPKYYTVIEKIFKILCEKFNCYVITVTATKPLFLEGIELVKNNERYFKSLDRIQFNNQSLRAMGLTEFCQDLKEDIYNNENKSFLIVLNTVKSSLQILKELREDEKLKEQNRKIKYLSTEIHPAKRLEIINEIKKNKNKKYILVSTQLIEAGVDVDFDIVYRDFSTMDSINQTAGRANRNGIGGKGIVKIFRLLNEDHNNHPFCQYIYSDTLLGITEKILEDREIIEESDIFEINQRYFKEVHMKKSNDFSNKLKEWICKLNFKQVRKNFQLIEEQYQKEDIIIDYNEETRACLEMIENGQGSYQETLNAWRKLNLYKVSVPKKDLDQIQCQTIKGINVLPKDQYDEEKGIIRTSIDIF